jgi:glucan phosphoethanolaminetransferase (alkaline phosphatase superfamily)
MTILGIIGFLCILFGFISLPGYIKFWYLLFSASCGACIYYLIRSSSPSAGELVLVMNLCYAIVGVFVLLVVFCNIRNKETKRNLAIFFLKYGLVFVAISTAIKVGIWMSGIPWDEASLLSMFVPYKFFAFIFVVFIYHVFIKKHFKSDNIASNI